MIITKLRVTCSKCGEVGDSEIVAEAPLNVALESMRSARCGSCGSSELRLGGAYSDAPKLTACVQDRAAWWLRRGDVGTSSQTIHSAFMGYRPSRVDIPYDPDDFQRCKLLLDLIPEWRSKLSTVLRAYPWFAPFIEEWPAMEALYADESPRKSFPKLCALMRKLVAQSRKMRAGNGDEHNG